MVSSSTIEQLEQLPLSETDIQLLQAVQSLLPDQFTIVDAATAPAGDIPAADGQLASSATPEPFSSDGEASEPLATHQAESGVGFHDADGGPLAETGEGAAEPAILHLAVPAIRNAAADDDHQTSSGDHQTSAPALSFAPASYSHGLHDQSFVFANFVPSGEVYRADVSDHSHPTSPDVAAPPTVETPAETAALGVNSGSSGADVPGVLVNGDGEIVSALSSSAAGPTGAAGGGGSSAAPTSAAGAASASPFVINVIYDASVSNAPAAFKTAVASAVQYFESQFTDHVTINIDVGYGEVGGYTLGGGALGESMTYLNSFSYAQIKSALTADAKSADDLSSVASLPSSSPVSGTFWESTAEAKAMGLMGASSNIDGYVGFAAGNLFDYNNSDGVSSGQYDFFGVVAHEISEVMGRALLAGGSIGSTSHSYYPLDLFHFLSSGVHDFSGTTPGYFSVNNGATNLDNFNTNAGGDFGDWAASAGNDAFLAFSPSGVVDALSQTDLRELDVLGWDRGSTGSTPTPPTPAPPPAQADLVVNNLTFDGTHFSYHVANNGAGSAGASTAGIYASTTASSLGSLIGTLSTGALAAGASDTESGTLTVSLGSAPTTFYLSVVADYKNVVVESNETNNASQKVALVVGTTGNNVLSGTAGNDIILGFGGNDILTGGVGADQFVFNTALGRTSGVATITDFSHAQGDKIDLDHTIFAALTQGAAGTPLAANNFFASANGAAHLAADHILYNSTTGTLSYDVDGIGSAAPIQFAVLTNHPTLAASDFMIV